MVLTSCPVMPAWDKVRRANLSDVRPLGELYPHLRATGELDAQIDALYATTPGLVVLPYQADGAADTTVTRTRMMVPVPQAYVHLLMGTRLNPRQLWEQVGGAIRNDHREVECAVLLQFLVSAAPLRRRTPEPEEDRRPEERRHGAVCNPPPPSSSVTVRRHTRTTNEDDEQGVPQRPTYLATKPSSISSSSLDAYNAAAFAIEPMEPIDLVLVTRFGLLLLLPPLLLLS